MGKIIRNGITYSGGSSGGNCTVRYVNNESDADYDYIQVKNADGTWKNWEYAALDGVYIVKDGVWNTKYTFKAYKDTTTQTITSDARGLKFARLSNSTTGAYMMSDDSFDVTNYSKIKFTIASFSCSSNGAAYAGLYPTNVANNLAVQRTFSNNVTEYEVDISELNGELYLGFVFPINTPTTIVFSDIHFE